MTGPRPVDPARRPPPHVWDRMSWLAQARWERRHAAWLAQRSAVPVPEPIVSPARKPRRPRRKLRDAADTIAYVERSLEPGRPRIDLASAAHELSIKPDSLLRLLARHDRRDLIAQLRGRA